MSRLTTNEEIAVDDEAIVETTDALIAAPRRGRIARGTDPTPNAAGTSPEPSDAFSLAYLRYLASAHGARK